MKPLPKDDPNAFETRVMDALIGDLWDREANGWPRLNALKAVHETTREAADKLNKRAATL